jgi:hypothetical protein
MRGSERSEGMGGDELKIIPNLALGTNPHQDSGKLTGRGVRSKLFGIAKATRTWRHSRWPGLLSYANTYKVITLRIIYQSISHIRGR